MGKCGKQKQMEVVMKNMINKLLYKTIANAIIYNKPVH